MAYGFVAEVDAATAATATTITRTVTYSAGENAIVVVQWGAATGTVTVADGTNTYTQLGATKVASSQGWSIAIFQARNVAAGAVTVTATFNATRTQRRISVSRYTGLADAAGHDSDGQEQVSPVVGTDAVTSLVMTPSSQPALVFGVTNTYAQGSVVNAGTGFTSRGVIASWDGLAGDTSRIEDKRVTSTSNVAATFTGTDSNEYFITIGGVFGEPVAAANMLPRRLTVMQAVNRASVF